MYLFFFVVLLFFSVHFYGHPQSKNFEVAWTIALLFFIGIAGLRYNIGIDYFTYSDSYESGDTLEQLFSGKHVAEYEPLYDLTCMVLRTLHLSPQMFFLLFSFFSSIVLFYVVKRFTERKFFFFSLLAYFSFVYLLMEMQAVRQSLAAGFLYLSFYQVLREKKFWAYILVVVAFLFHSSAIFIILLFPFLDKRLHKPVQLSIIGISVFVMIAKIRWLYGIIESISAFFPSAFFASRLLEYTTNSTISSERGVFISFFIYLSYYLFIYIVNRKNRGYFNSRSGIIAQNLFLFYLVFTPLFWELSFISTRIGWYLLFGLVICLPQVLDMFVVKQRLAPIVFVILFCLIPFRTFVIPDETTMMMVPYEGYIECKIFGVESTGRERAQKYADEHETEFRY